MIRHPAKLARRARDTKKADEAKRRLLPLSREATDAMALEYYTALAALKEGRGSEHGVRALLQMAVVAGFIGEASAVKIDPEVLRELDRALCDAFDRGDTRSEWSLDAATAQLCAALLVEHERQLRMTSRKILQEVVDRVNRLKRGERYGSSRA